jgi:hypothetical protein
MNADGWGQVGAGVDDNRLAGRDLQHNRQTRTADELHLPVGMVRQSAESGGPMKEYVDNQEHKSPMQKLLESEKDRHEASMKHQQHHISRHSTRHHDSQHGQDTYKY